MVQSLETVEERVDEELFHADRSGGVISRIVSWLPTVLTVALVVTFWETFLILFDQPEYILPPLHDILQTSVDEASDTLLPAAWVTLQEILLGFGLGALVGLALGVAIFHSTVVRRSFLPLVIATQAVPVIAIAPILVIWFGFGVLPKVLVAAMIAFFPVAINTIAGLGTVDRETIDLMHSLDAGRWQIFSKIRFPAALPFIFAGLKNAAAISVIGAIVGEWVGATEGLGPVMIAANASFSTDVVFAAIFYLAAIGVSLFVVVGLIERLVIPWHFLSKD